MIMNLERVVALNIRSLPWSLRQRFKVLCARENRTMEEKLTSMIEHEVVVSGITDELVERQG